MAKIQVSKALFDQREVKAVSRVLLQDGYTGMGKEVKLFEDEIQKFLQTKKEVVAVNSGTAALHLAVAAVTKPGDEVLVQSFTYVASFQAISAAGAVPVACEVNPLTGTIDLADAAKRLTKKTKAIMPVHYASDPGNLQEIYAFAKKHKLRVIEDAAHAFGTVYKGKLIGNQGDIICFSFDGIKNITAGEGGVLITADRKVAEYAKDARLLGVQKDSEKRYAGQRSYEFDVTHQGYRYHMSNINAAIGRVQLQKFPYFKKTRQVLAKRYETLLRDMPGIELFKRNYDAMVPHIFVIKVLNGKRDGLKDYFDSKQTARAVHYYPNHLLTLYRKKGIKLPITELLYSQVFTLPLHAGLTFTDQDKIVSEIKKFVSK